jgi:hypothetical protein
MQPSSGFATICGCLLAAACAQAPLRPEVRAVVDHLNGDAVIAHIRFLADDLLEGRGTGTRGHEVASKYIAAQLETMGLKPAGVNGSYYQFVPLRERTVDKARCELSLDRGRSNEHLAWGRDFLMGGNPESPDVRVEARVIYVGYGVVAPDQDYDDYAGIDVHGKIVAGIAGAPPTFPTDARAHYSSDRLKFRGAVERGAVGYIQLTSEEVLRSLPWERIVTGADFPSMNWLDSTGAPSDYFPQIAAAASLSLPATERLFQGSGHDWKQVWADARAGRARGFALPVTARLHAVSRHRELTSPNVLAVLPGSDSRLKNEYVIYTAHSDHLGIGPPINGDGIYNGAADNASGIGALIELARAFVRLPRAPARSIVFLAVTAEEKGLLGSDYYAHFPTVPVKDIVANINMDIAGLFYESKDVIALGVEHSSLGSVARGAAQQIGVVVVPDPMPEQAFFVRSDQYSFVRAGVPSLNIGCGYTATDPKVDAEKFINDWITRRYHAPSDDMSQPMDARGIAQFMRINFLVGYHVAQERERPRWNQGDFFGDTFVGK